MSQTGTIHLARRPGEIDSVQFIELFDEWPRRAHVGCLMDIGHNWVDVSLPSDFALPDRLWLTFYPDPTLHGVKEVSRKNYCVRLEFRGFTPDVQIRRMVRSRQRSYTPTG